MKYINQVTEVYRVDTEEEVQAFIEDLKTNAMEEGYILKSCAYTLKEKKSRGDVVDSAWQLKVVKEHATFWDC
jgi:hypothetical protein